MSKKKTKPAVIQVGPTTVESSAIAESICKVLETASDKRIDEETTRAALKALSESVSVSGITISGCHIQGS